MATVSRALEFADPLIGVSWGNILEADLFETLRQCPEIARASEFGLADGAVDCTRYYAFDDSFAERFWDMHCRDSADCSDLGLFDGKATINLDTEKQQFLSTVGQQRRVAFYLCVHASNLDFIDLIPNFHQDSAALVSPATIAKENEYLSVTVRKRSRLFAAAHDSLDLTGTPYRLRRQQLPLAIRRVRDHLLGISIYVNPFTGVSFPDWRPLMTRNIAWLKPSETNDHYTAFEEAMNLYPAIKLGGSLRTDFVGLQPLLADFKFVPVDSASSAAGMSEPRPSVQWFVQHKVDGHLRARGVPLTKVAIARNGRYYFDARSRPDFIMYYFEFGKHNPDKTVFFLPEKVIPDEFYSTFDVEADFEIDAFLPYRIPMDRDFGWVEAVSRIIFENPRPKCQHERPIRQEPVAAGAVARTLSTGKCGKPKEMLAQAKKNPRGSSLHSKAMLEGHRRFFYTAMEQCAIRRSGLLVEQARTHPSADYGVCAWDWTPEEASAFLSTGRLPATAQDLPPGTPMTPVLFYTSHRECHASGLRITWSQFRRLNCNNTGRLIIWDIGGEDSQQQPLFAVVPSSDIQPTPAQIARINSNAEAEKRGKDVAHNPTISSMLATGLPLAAYTQPSGPACYGQDAWSKLWMLLDNFTRLEPVCHPASIVRHPSHFRQTMLDFNVRLARQFETDDRARALSVGGDEAAVAHGEDDGDDDEEDEE